MERKIGEKTGFLCILRDTQDKSRKCLGELLQDFVVTDEISVESGKPVMKATRSYCSVCGRDYDPDAFGRN